MLLLDWSGLQVLCEITEQAPVKRLKQKHDLSGVGSVGLTLTGNLDPQKFNTFIGNVLQNDSKNLYRSKGVVSLEGEGDTKFVFQGVHEQVVFSPISDDWAVPIAERVNKMVFIGRNLNKEQLQEEFEACKV